MVDHHPHGLGRTLRRRLRRVRHWARSTPSGEVVGTLVALVVVSGVVLAILLYVFR